MSRIADVGSGTGILTRALLDATGGYVVAVEPNAAMRAAAEKALAGEPRFESRDGSAEATGLPDADVDLVIAAQAFHWFDPARTRVEFARILRRVSRYQSAQSGKVALVWNQRSDTPLNRDYLEMLERFAPEYPHVRESERSSEPKMRAFFAPTSPRRASFPNAQRLDEAGFRGRLLSSSYAPPEGHPLHAPILLRLGEIFHAHQQDGHITLQYETIVWYGAL
ncbi:MAG TPA: class I SAM-dependent methyltransferase [Polyangiaceae bacterium]|nr:class I SAM-dependent methyltransferase [Polyangiaceae bacterium]